jgi:hypothetical protein
LRDLGSQDPEKIVILCELCVSAVLTPSSFLRRSVTADPLMQDAGEDDGGGAEALRARRLTILDSD